MNMKTMKVMIYKWLPIIFGCHCLNERSFYYKNQKFPICARCTGELLGICLGIIGWFFIRWSLISYIIMLIPLIIDGTVQMFSMYESNNLRRLWTGFLFGYGIVTMFIMSNIFCFEVGFNLKVK